MYVHACVQAKEVCVAINYLRLVVSHCLYFIGTYMKTILLDTASLLPSTIRTWRPFVPNYEAKMELAPFSVGFTVLIKAVTRKDMLRYHVHHMTVLSNEI